MSAFLELLKSSLVVDIATGDSSASALPLFTRFVVRNVATNSDSAPEIFFDEVLLTVGVPPNMHVEKHTNLASGESFSYEYHSRYSDLGKVVYSIEGKISPSRLLRVRNAVTSIPAIAASISIPSYIAVLKDINIHRWLRGVLEEMTLSETGTTDADTKALQAKLGDAIKEIRDTKSQLERINSFIVRHTDTDRQNVTKHRTLIENYLTHTDQACGELRTMLETHNAKTINATRIKLKDSLSVEANNIDEAGERLVQMK